MLRREFAETEQPLPTRTYTVFAEVMEAPIFSFGEIRGVLGVWSRDTGRFEESDLRLIEAFASLASIALRNAEAYEESVRQTRVERGFYRIAAVLSEPLSEQETLDAVAQAAAEALGGGSAAVLRPAGDELSWPALTSSLTGWLPTSGSPRPRSSRVFAAARCSRLVGSATTSASAAAWDARPRGPRLAPGCAAPAAGRPRRARARLLRGRADFRGRPRARGPGRRGRAGALERSELFERERRSRHLAQRLARAGREGGELDPDDVLDQVARHAVELLDGDGASVRVLEGDEVVVRAAAGPGAADALETRALDRARRRPHPDALDARHRRRQR